MKRGTKRPGPVTARARLVGVVHAPGGILGVAVLWAVPCGAAFELAINEGLAGWQLATGATTVEGAVHHFGLLERTTISTRWSPSATVIG